MATARRDSLGGVWYPRTWPEVQALIGQAVETSNLDFKRSISKHNDELAKDIAAMTLDGGVLLYGIDEHRQTTLAREVTPIQIAGVETRLQQVIGSHIRPVPDVATEFIASPDDPTTGVLVVLVPASLNAPHQAGGRYPCRRGTTTGFLEEAEVERLYRQRRSIQTAPVSAADLTETQFVAVLADIGAQGIGHMSLIVKPRSPEAGHPAGPWQATHLREAVRLAAHEHRQRFNNITLVRCFNQLGTWEPNGVAGWAAGKGGRVTSSRSDAQQFGASLAYPARLSFQAQWGLHAVDANDRVMHVSAREIDVARELTAMLAIAGEYFSTVTGAGLLAAGLRLRGFEKSISQLGTETGRLTELPGALDGVTTAAETSPLELSSTPEAVAQRLIENWLPPFYMVDGEKLDQHGLEVELFDLVVNVDTQREGDRN